MVIINSQAGFLNNCFMWTIDAVGNILMSSSEIVFISSISQREKTNKIKICWSPNGFLPDSTYGIKNSLVSAVFNFSALHQARHFCEVHSIFLPCSVTLPPVNSIARECEGNRKAEHHKCWTQGCWIQYLLSIWQTKKILKINPKQNQSRTQELWLRKKVLSLALYYMDNSLVFAIHWCIWQPDSPNL